MGAGRRGRGERTGRVEGGGGEDRQEERGRERRKGLGRENGGELRPSLSRWV